MYILSSLVVIQDDKSWSKPFFSLLVGLGYTQDIYEFVSFLTIPFHKGIPKESEKPPIYILGFVCLVIFYGFDPMGFIAIEPTTIWQNMFLTFSQPP